MKMRLINANKYCDFLNKYPLEKAQNNFMNFYRDALQYTFECEIDAEPVKHGHWIFNPKDAIEMMFILPKCSECGAESSDGGNYCPNCGAKMDETKEQSKGETKERREEDA